MLKCRRLAAVLMGALYVLIAPAAESKWIPGARYAGKLDSKAVPIPSRRSAPAHEMRGVWIATVENIDFAQCQTAEEFQRQAATICANVRKIGANAIFFQVRPCNDAFYASKLNPWSRYLTGKEGVALSGKKGFDPLQCMIAEAHRNHLEFHAWLNPYRVTRKTKLSKSAYLNTLAPNNFARLHPELVLSAPQDDGIQLVLNPAEPRVRAFVADTVMELVKNYDVDGIHFDDYFYPERVTANADAAQYKKYNRRYLELEDWRRENVTELIRLVHKKIRQFNQTSRRKVRFGVSPFGIWRNKKSTPEGSLTAGSESYAKQRADTRLWVRERLIDYVAPQIYWNFGHDVAAYAALVDWWSETVHGTGVDLYVGHGVYRMGQPGWGLNELYYQLMYNRQHPEIKGSILYSYRNLVTPANATMKKGGAEMLRSLWATPTAGKR